MTKPVDMTPIVHAAPDSRRDAFTPMPHAGGTMLSQTEFATLGARSTIVRFHQGDITGTAGNFSQAGDPVPSEAQPSMSDELAKTVSTRTLILARHFGAGVDREELSRLEILTARLRKLSPRVTEEQIDLQAEMVGMVEDISFRLAATRARLNVE
ncbi:hypothetical protein WKW80_34800 [Variovorax humicola]|uniref:Class II flagellar assembly regulator n=1 Tax=Variovorax humicola TaxID=1769758 RepID=A0ABU8WAM6_9BURK